MSITDIEGNEVYVCRGCGGQARKIDASTPDGWYSLTVSVPEWYSTGSGKDYVWIGMFCSVTCLVAYGPQLQADADLAHQAYDPVIPKQPARNPQGMRHPRQ